MFDWWSTTQYLPGILSALLAGILTGVVAGAVAIGTARHEVRQAEKRRKVEQADRDAQEAAVRRDALNRQVVSEFSSALGKLLASIHRRDDLLAGDAFQWADSRAVQVVLLLHAQSQTALMEWFRAEWKKVMLPCAMAMYPSQVAGRWELHVPEDQQGLMENDVIALEFVSARWSTQRINEWSTEKPPPEIVSLSPEAFKSSEGGVE